MGPGRQYAIRLASFFYWRSQGDGGELLQGTMRCPEQFSANVLLRPLIQDYLLPTLCYIGGPDEVAYFAQIEVCLPQAGRQGDPDCPTHICHA